MGQEIDLEYCYTALEVTRGTAIATPTRNLGVMSSLTPKSELNKPDDARGTLYGRYRSNIVREWCEWEGEGDVDLNTIHHLLAGAVKGGVTPTLVETGVQSWVFVPSAAADDLKSYSVWWGEPSVQVWRAPYCMLEELVIEVNGSGTDGVKFSFKGRGQKLATIAAPSAIAVGSLLSLPPARMDAYIDIVSAIGTTSVTARILSAKHTIPTNISFKHGPVGAAGAGGNTFRRTGRKKRQITTEVELEVLDTTDITNFLNGSLLKLRCQYNTEALIGATQRGFLRVDTYGYAENLEWGELEDTNRTVKFTIESIVDPTLGADFGVTVQNSTTTA